MRPRVHPDGEHIQASFRGELKALSQKVVAMAEAQTAAITKVEAALVALKEAISDLAKGGRNAAA